MPFCERCPEKRLVCLSIHHVHGKQEDVFETLCHNCHAAEHAGNSGTITMEDELKWVEEKKKKEEEQKERNNKIIKLSSEGLSIKDIASLFNLSRECVRKVVSKTESTEPSDCQSPEELKKI
jgi:DNA invertase Pin-like site-specific DNA recombinase